jgi:hypothetical protein
MSNANRAIQTVAEQCVGLIGPCNLRDCQRGLFKMAANAPATAIGVDLATRTAMIENGFLNVQDLVKIQD